MVSHNPAKRTGREGSISMKNYIRDKIADGKLVFGVGLSLGSIRSAEVLFNCKPDFLMVDLLHGHFDKASATDALRSMIGSEVVPFARVANNDPGQINDMLDAGALGLIVPMVNTPAEAERAVKSTFYHPKGERSKGSIATVAYGPEYHEQANETIQLVIMLETLRSLGSVDEILSVEGIDLCLIGASDLTYEMGCSRTDKAFSDAVAGVLRSAETRGIPVGISVSTADEAFRWRSQGISFFLASHDMSLYSACARNFISSFREIKK
jgi:4-hydroxy-2-oxoheptanedioate aldolase